MSRAKRNPRRGVAAVEFAVLLPVFVLLVLGTIEATSMIFLQQTLEIAAYEGARVGLVPDSTAGNVEGAARQILDARNVHGSTTTVVVGVDLTGSDFDGFYPIDARNIINVRQQEEAGVYEARGWTLEWFNIVTVEVPCDENSLFSPWFYAGRTLSADVALRWEFN